MWLTGTAFVTWRVAGTVRSLKTKFSQARVRFRSFKLLFIKIIFRSYWWGVGTKSDLKGDASQRENPEDKDITQAEGEKLAKIIRATCYIETSSKTGDGVKEVLQKAINAAMGVGKKPW